MDQHILKHDQHEEFVMDKFNLYNKTDKMKKMKTIKIQGNDYILVKDKVKYFRENFPNFALTSERVKETEGEIIQYNGKDVIRQASVLFRAEVRTPEGFLVSTGWAREEKNSSKVNKTNWIENAETSAIGRALAFFGIGVDISIASADEMENALEKEKYLKK